MILNILLALLILNVMVIAHEFGHYIMARRNGIDVDEFAVGFGPVLLKKKWNGTLWLLKAFPLGGYNGLKGETASEGGKGNFVSASKKAKLQVLIAGSLMNVVMAVLAFYASLWLYGWKTPVPMEFTPIGATITPVKDAHPMVIAVAKDSPAEKAGLVLPYSIVEVNGKIVTSPKDVVTEIGVAVSDDIRLKVLVGEEERDVTMTRDSNKKLGISVSDPALQLDYTKGTHKLFAGFSHSINMTVLTGKFLGSMISFTAKTGDLEPLSYALAGPVAIVAAVESVVKDSQTIVADLFNMMGLIGISLAVFNLLPFPGLDGWHIFLLGYEKARGRKANEKLVNIVSAIGLFILLGLGVLIMVKDVWFFFIK